MGLFSGSGLTPSLKGVSTNVIALNAGQVSVAVPAGWYYAVLSPYHVIQQFDPITNIWRGIGGAAVDAKAVYFYSDGVNYRIANQTGCVVGALLTNAGSGYTSAPTVTASAGGSIWRAIVGGAVSTSVTVTNGGANYTYAPLVTFSAPPPGGIQATGYATLTGGAVSSITVTDQGAGYSAPPTVTLTNDPREGVNGVTTGYGAAAVAALTGAGTVTGLLVLDHGNAVTSLPTLTIAGGGGSSAAATAIMNWTVTGLTAGTAGAGLSGAFATVTAEDNFPATAPAYTNVTTQSRLVATRRLDAKFTVTAGALAGTAVIYDGGAYTSAPTVEVWANASVVTTAPVVTATVGGAYGVSYLTQL